MKKYRILALIAVLVLVFGLVGTAGAQLGDSDVSSFTVQNVDSTNATVTITFVAENGTEITPTVLNASKANPFTLTPGESWEVYVPGIPAAQLPNGRYSVVIASTAQVVGIANLVGQGSVNFNGSYSGFSSGATTFYLPAVAFNAYGWYSLISVQNVGSGPADVTVTINCENGPTGTLTATNVPIFSSHHFDLETTTPSGFTSSTKCIGSAVVTADQPVVAVDNQTVPGNGNTQSYSGVVSGAPKLYAAALYTEFYGWNSSINIRKLGAGSTTVTVTYSNGGSSTCNLSDSAPGCLLYMPAEKPTPNQYFGATIQSSPSMDLVAVVNAANGSQAQTYNAVSGGTGAVGIPSVMKSYYGWNTSFTCQNIGSVTTTFNIKYDGHASDAYNTDPIAPGGSIEVFTPGESFLPPSNWQGGATVTANAGGAQVSCIVNFNHPGQMASTAGDWSMSYNAFNK
ncbi:MAG: hypothetical protein JSV42_15885 [Chloroflexota bacterium]|nr:MAG: hypothetical protein JSV42_15885 [Chloroflexota bacterium]